MKRLLPFALINLFSLGVASAASPWLPGAGKITVTETVTSDSFFDYRQGATPRILPASYDQSTFITNVEWGVRENLSVDFETGHTAADFRGNTTAGVMDSTIGVRWLAKRGERWVLTVRAAALIRGSYDVSTNGNWSAGDKGSGGQGSVMYGVQLPHRFFGFSEMGYRIRNNNIPQDFFGTAGGGYFIKSITFASDYQTARSINGVDISGGLPKFNPPYFTAAMFPQTKKIFGAIDESVAYGFRNGLSFGFSYSKILHGRNVGLKDVYAGSVSYTLPVRLPHF